MGTKHLHPFREWLIISLSMLLPVLGIASNTTAPGTRYCSPSAGEVAGTAAAVSLSRLWQQHGQQAEARQPLADVYGWLTEGFDTPELPAAALLLQELQRAC
jgi:hypothetical protein